MKCRADLPTVQNEADPPQVTMVMSSQIYQWEIAWVSPLLSSVVCNKSSAMLLGLFIQKEKNSPICCSSPRRTWTGPQPVDDKKCLVLAAGIAIVSSRDSPANCQQQCMVRSSNVSWLSCYGFLQFGQWQSQVAPAAVPLVTECPQHVQRSMSMQPRTNIPDRATNSTMLQCVTSAAVFLIVPVDLSHSSSTPVLLVALFEYYGSTEFSDVMKMQFLATNGNINGSTNAMLSLWEENFSCSQLDQLCVEQFDFMRETWITTFWMPSARTVYWMSLLGSIKCRVEDTLQSSHFWFALHKGISGEITETEDSVVRISTTPTTQTEVQNFLYGALHCPVNWDIPWDPCISAENLLVSLIMITREACDELKNSTADALRNITVFLLPHKVSKLVSSRPPWPPPNCSKRNYFNRVSNSWKCMQSVLHTVLLSRHIEFILKQLEVFAIQVQSMAAILVRPWDPGAVDLSAMNILLVDCNMLRAHSNPGIHVAAYCDKQWLHNNSSTKLGRTMLTLQTAWQWPLKCSDDALDEGYDCCRI